MSPLAQCQGDTLGLQGSPPSGCPGTPILTHSPSSWKKDPGATGMGILPLNKGGLNLPCGLWPPALGLGEGGCSLSFLQIRCHDTLPPPHIDWGSVGGTCDSPPGQPAAASMQAVGCWTGCLLDAPPRPMPSLAPCLPSLTKSLSSLMAALMTEFISGPACPAGGPEEGVSPLGLAWGPPPLCHTSRLSPATRPLSGARPPGCHTPPKTQPHTPTGGSAPR